MRDVQAQLRGVGFSPVTSLKNGFAFRLALFLIRPRTFWSTYELTRNAAPAGKSKGYFMKQ